jgi:hypothetical protein
MSKIKNGVSDKRDPTTKRLDCIIRLFIEVLKNSDKKSFNDGSVSRVLFSAGLTPSEIALILGKKSYTDIAPYLYSKK